MFSAFAATTDVDRFQFEVAATRFDEDEGVWLPKLKAMTDC